MRIENEMLSRFGNTEMSGISSLEMEISKELDFFFENVMDTVVDYFKVSEDIKV